MSADSVLLTTVMETIILLSNYVVFLFLLPRNKADDPLAESSFCCYAAILLIEAPCRYDW